ncbi:MAG TPA: nuclear transport factor 2 family protein [Thermoleophilaceae bacterium]|nr:nuclear transport factor 2 family protein [Thermoleophilaceae bacterium]
MEKASNLELLRERLGKAYSDPEAFFEILHPDVEWDIRDSSSPMAGLYHGREAVRDFYRRWAGAFSDWSYELDELIEGQDVVVAFVTERGHGRGSGVEVTMQRANVWTFRDGMVVRFQSFSNRPAALAAAGLSSGA